MILNGSKWLTKIIQTNFSIHYGTIKPGCSLEPAIEDVKDDILQNED